MSVDIDIGNVPRWKQETVDKKLKDEDCNNIYDEEDWLAKMPAWKRDIIKRKRDQKNSLVYLSKSQPKRSNGSVDIKINSLENTSSKQDNSNSYDYSTATDHDSTVLSDHLVPVQQNPWVLTDSNKKFPRSTSVGDTSSVTSYSNSHDNSCNENESFVFCEIDTSDRSIDVDYEDVPYGRGFVNKLLQKFSNMSTVSSSYTRRSSPNISPKRSYSTEDILIDKENRDFCNNYSPNNFNVSATLDRDYIRRKNSNKYHPKAASMDNLSSPTLTYCEAESKRSACEFEVQDLNNKNSPLKDFAFSDEVLTITQTNTESSNELKIDIGIAQLNNKDSQIHFASARSFFENVSSPKISNQEPSSSPSVPELHQSNSPSSVVSTSLNPSFSNGPKDLMNGFEYNNNVVYNGNCLDNEESISVQVETSLSDDLSIINKECNRPIPPKRAKRKVAPHDDFNTNIINSHVVKKHDAIKDSNKINSNLTSISKEIPVNSTNSLPSYGYTNHDSKYNEFKVERPSSINVEKSKTSINDSSQNRSKKVNSKSKASHEKGSLLVRPASNILPSGQFNSQCKNINKYNDVRTGDFEPAKSRPLYYTAYDDSLFIPVTNIDDVDFINDFEFSQRNGVHEIDADVHRTQASRKFEFIGSMVKLARSLLDKSRSQKLSISFDDESTTTFEYQSEQSLLETMPPEPGDFDYPIKYGSEEEPAPLASDENGLDSDEDDDTSPDKLLPVATLKSTPSMSSSGDLANYKSRLVHDYVMGERPPEETVVVRPRENEYEEPIDSQITPAYDDDVSSWSNTGSSDLLF